MTRIPDDIARRVAAAINEAEDAIATYQESKKDIYADLREELKAAGFEGAAISAEVGYLKAAIAKSRKLASTPDQVHAKDEGVDDYLAILSRARAPARARETIEEFDPETGELPSVAGSGDGLNTARTGSAADEIPVTNNPAPQPPAGDDGHPSIPTSEAAGAKMDRRASANPERAGQPVDIHSNSEEAVPDYVPSFLAKSVNIRPHCLNPDLCAGSGRNHCHACLKAMQAESEPA